MARIVWTEPALADLEEIAEYIALDKPPAANALLTDVLTRVERLHNFPEAGRKPPELPKGSRYRELIVGPCRIFCRKKKSTIYLLYVMRSKRKLRQYVLAERTKSS